MISKKASWLAFALSLISSCSMAMGQSSPCPNPPCDSPIVRMCDNPPCAWEKSECASFVPKSAASKGLDGYVPLAACASAVCSSKRKLHKNSLFPVVDLSSSDICKELKYQDDKLACPENYENSPAARPQEWVNSKCSPEQRKEGDVLVRRLMATKASHDVSRGLAPKRPEDIIKGKLESSDKKATVPDGPVSGSEKYSSINESPAPALKDAKKEGQAEMPEPIRDKNGNEAVNVGD